MSAPLRAGSLDAAAARPASSYAMAGSGKVPRAAPPDGLVDRLLERGPAMRHFDEEWTWDAAWAVMASSASAESAASVAVLERLLSATRRSPHFDPDPERSVVDRFALLRLLFPMLVAIDVAGQERGPLAGLSADHCDWLARMVAVETQPAGSVAASPSRRNNHLLLREATAMQWGALAGDGAAFARGPAAFASTLAGLDDEGCLAEEAARGASAAWYTNLALMLLVSIGHVAAARGQALWRERFGGRSLDDAIGFYLRAVAEPQLFWPYSRANRFPHPRHGSDPFAIDLSFLDTYHRSRHYLAWLPLYLADSDGGRHGEALRAMLPKNAFFPLVCEFAGGAIERFLPPAVSARF